MDKIYKLLRDNRQTGPYTLEELVQLGLKPFDLLWADGVTAGWMYPSEIAALKPYGVEERIESATATPPVAVPGADAPSAAPQPAALPVVDKQPAVPSSAKHIFISMPAGALPKQPAPAQAIAVPGALADEETADQKLERKAAELRQKVQALAEAKAEPGEPALDTKYARSLDEIKEEYAHWMHEQQRKGQGIKLSKKQWRAAALVLAVAAIGYLAFQWIGAPEATSPSLAAGPQLSDTPMHASTIAVKENEAPAQSVINTDVSGRNQVMLEELEGANKQIEADLERMSAKEKTKAATAAPSPSAEPDISGNYGTSEEPYPHRRSESGRVESTASSSPTVRTVANRSEAKPVTLSQQIDLSAKYLRASRGKGLSGVELTLRNNSNQVLKTVAIDVFYYRDDNRQLDKETVYFNNVLPGEQLKLTAPGHKRATSATYQLGLISSDGGLYVARQ